MCNLYLLVGVENPTDYKVTWTDIKPKVTGRQGHENVLRTPGPQLLGDAQHVESPLECWELFFTKEMEETVVHWTNKKIERVRSQMDEAVLNNSKNSYLKTTDVMELRAYYGVTYARGLLHDNMTDQRKLWGESSYGHPIYSGCIPVNRYAFLKHNITFDDIDSREERWQSDRFTAMREFFEAANDNFSKMLQPDAYLTIDETLYGTRNQISFKQYNPNKPARYGVLFKSVNASLIPYTFVAAVYAGKPVGQPTQHYIKGTSAIVKSLVNRLSENTDLRGRNITTARLYTTYDLTQWLLNRSMTTVGTLMSKRKGIPKEFLTITDRECPSYKLLYNKESQGTVTLHSYVVNTKSSGKRNVLLLSSQPPLLGVTKDVKKKPAIYKFYDYTKGGTDAVDYRMGVNTVKTKSKRWISSVVAYLLDTMRVNAQTIQALSQGKNPRTTDSIDFGWTLAIQLAKPHMERRRTVGGLSAYVQRCIDLLIGRAEHVAARPPQNPAAPRRCDLCVENLRGQPNYKKEKRQHVQSYIKVQYL